MMQGAKNDARGQIKHEDQEGDTKITKGVTARKIRDGFL